MKTRSPGDRPKPGRIPAQRVHALPLRSNGVSSPGLSLSGILNFSTDLHSSVGDETGSYSMRIIAGKYRRRLLQSNAGSTTRPITDRAKVILFDRLEQYLPETRVLDLFSGTGSLGLESLSRGAASVVCIEGDVKAHELLKENVASLKVEDEVLCWKTDALYSSFKPKHKEGWFPFDVIFFDPPYRLLEKLKPDSPLAKSIERFTSDEVSAPGCLLIVRCSKFAEYQLPAVWHLEQELVIGSMGIWIYRKGQTEQKEAH